MDAKKLFIDIEMTARDKLEQHYNVSPMTGFLADFAPDKRPLTRFPAMDHWEWDRYLSRFDDLGYTLPENIVKKRIAKVVDELPLPPEGLIDHLGQNSKQSVIRLQLVTSMLMHSYFPELMQCKRVDELLADDSNKSLPPQLAVPLYEASVRTGIAPSMSYNLYGNSNYRFIVPGSLKITPDSVRMIHSFTGGKSENGFVVIHQGMEAKHAPAIFAMYRAHLLALRKNDWGNPACTEKMTEWLHLASRIDQEVVDILERMPKYCDSTTYFANIRMFYTVPRNVIYEGVDELKGEPQNILGETGGQTPQMQFKNMILGINLEDDEYFPRMRLHMFREHRELIEMVMDSPVREFVLEHKNIPALVRRYNALLRCVIHWRNEHISLVNTYITPYGESHGTGKPPLGWLNKLYEKTKELIIPE